MIWTEGSIHSSTARFRSSAGLDNTTAVCRPSERSEWDGEQRVEPAAVADDDAFAQPERAPLVHEGVEIAAGGEEIHRPIAHDAHNEKRRFGACHLALGADDRRQADEVSIALALVDV